MTPEIENEQLRTRLAEMAAEVERLSHERQCLAEAIGRIAVASGDTRTDFTGPDLLMVCGDAAEGIKHLMAENARLRAEIDAANAQEPDGFLSVVPLDGLHKHSTILARPFSPVLDGQRFYFRPIPAQQSPAVTVPDIKQEYKLFCKFCDENPSLNLDPRLHTHSGQIESGGYIEQVIANVAFKAWRARAGVPSPRITEQTDGDYIKGECYIAGLWSDRNIDAFIEDGNRVGGAISSEWSQRVTEQDARLHERLVITNTGEKMLTEADLEKIKEIESEFKDGLELGPEQVDFLCSKLRDLNAELQRVYKDVY